MRVVSAFFVAAGASTFANDSPIDLGDVTRLTRDALKAWNVPGAAVVVVTRDRVLYLNGIGQRELARPAPVTENTIFPLASCSKAFTATLIGQLVDEGKMAWDDPVRMHLPEFRLADPLANAGVTIRDLLCHRTGLSGHDALWYRSPLPMDELVRRLAFLPPTRPFRTTFQYQSLMFTAAGLAAANAAHQPWDQLVRTRLFAPLGMRTASCVSPNLNATDDRAMPHRLDATGNVKPISWYEQLQPNPAGSIHLSAHDLASWLMFQLGEGSSQGRPIISAKNLAETHAPQIAQRMEGISTLVQPDTVMMSYGLGWVIQDYNGTLLWTHTGVIDGFRAQIALAPREGFGVAVLSNLHETRMNLALVNALLDRRLKLPPKDWNAQLKWVVAQQESFDREAHRQRDVRRVAGAPSPLALYAGRYENPAYGAVAIEKVGDDLVWIWNAYRVTLKHFAGQEFDLPDAALGEPALTFTQAGEKINGFHLFDVEFSRK